MKDLLVRFCITVLVFALVAVPCLTPAGIFQTDALAAQPASPLQAGFSQSYPGGKHGSAHAQALSAGNITHCPPSNMYSCCDDCVIWQVARRFDDQQMTDTFYVTENPGAGAGILAAYGLAQEFQPPDSMRELRHSGLRVALHTIPVYALSQRFRI